MDAKTARAIDLLHEASVEMRRELDHLTRLMDDQHRLIAALHDVAVNEHALRLVHSEPQADDASERATAGLF